MKILYLGEISPGQTCRMRMRALERLGHQVLGVDTVQPWKEAGWFTRQWQRRLAWGAIVDQVNQSVLHAARQFRPQILWADKQQYLQGEVVQEVSKLGARTIHFTPDPYFTLDWKRTRLMDEALTAFDAFVCCKRYELKQYQKLGKPVVEMPLGYCDETHRPLPSSDPCWNCSVGFLGSWEPRRGLIMAKLAKEGYDLKIWGYHWDFVQDGRWTIRRRIILGQLAGSEPFRIHCNPSLAKCWQGGEVYGDDYAHALTGAKIGLGFLRKVCPDQHTTRTFEIPACGSMLLADRTDEHRAFFEEGKEAEFFDSEAELIDKVRFYTTHEDARVRIADAGLNRCRRSGYSYLERMRGAMEAIGG